MNEDQVRAVVRATLARRVGQPTPAAQVAAVAPSFTAASPAREAPRPAWLTHPSHLTIALVRPDADGPCLIEPSVTCNQCGFCQSVGH